MGPGARRRVHLGHAGAVRHPLAVVRGRLLSADRDDRADLRRRPRPLARRAQDRRAAGIGDQLGHALQFRSDRRRFAGGDPLCGALRTEHHQCGRRCGYRGTDPVSAQRHGRARSPVACCSSRSRSCCRAQAGRTLRRVLARRGRCRCSLVRRRRPSRSRPTASPRPPTRWSPNPLFFNGKRVRRSGMPVQRDRPRSTELDAHAQAGLHLLERATVRRSDGEIRGEFWDLGRMQEGDRAVQRPRFHAGDRSGEQRALAGPRPGIRACSPPPSSRPGPDGADDPRDRADARAVRQSRRHAHRAVQRTQLFGDLPQGVAKSKWDFVLQSADAAIWVTRLRPRARLRPRSAAPGRHRTVARGEGHRPARWQPQSGLPANRCA